MATQSLVKYAWLSIAAALVTIILKLSAYFVTGSVGLLSDAVESFVNLAAAGFALFAIKLAEKPPDEEHMYGHSKIEYFSSIFEGILILIAALAIGWTAVDRIIHPRDIEQAMLGLIISTGASLVNLFVALKLLGIGKKHNSIIFEADAHHLLTDVWTSVGVIAGVFLVSVTHIQILDPAIAVIVAINIVVTGIVLMKRSAVGLMDSAISKEENDKIITYLKTFENKKVHYHAMRTRQSGMRKFVSLHVLVPGDWSVQKGHNLLEEMEKGIRGLIPRITVTTHLEPIDDPVSLEDGGIE
ncbi:cation transporter [Candidatus Roizmanbacteria bacterium]|nr:cation transporter [Candidatus Roizmanbacteria bacterium]